jgi:iron complex transport system permease protein
LLWLALTVVLLAALMVLSVVIGSREVSWTDIMAGVRGSTENLGQAAVLKRMPRTLLAVLVGGALGVAGAVMQGVTRNPIQASSV